VAPPASPPSPTPPRQYDSTRRQAAALANRRAILDACRELLFRDGYQATTIRAVADQAGLSPETVYKAFGNKPQMLKALWDITLAGDDAPLSMAERPEIQTVLATPDPHAKLAVYAAFVSGIHERLAALFTLLTGADPEVAQLLDTAEQERLTGVTAFIGLLARDGVLRPGADQRTAADACWVLTSPHLFIKLTAERHWDVGAYRRWLADMLTATFL
jgi:AcrR family transcriptional regulator